uniref:ABC-2 type transporter n=1 Tax=Porphyridium sordidum TaxID=28024 RepID=A0A1C9CDL3_PORSO|nr:ABC-2 type transporter [Porphyridium sordidum]AOM66483.1 ABC-2 type transporter [Porphyridium sordidum]
MRNNFFLQPQVNRAFVKKQDAIYYIHIFLEEIYGLNKRLFIQTTRRSATFIAGTVQPMLWLFLFGSLFRDMNFKLTEQVFSYDSFLTSGIIIFTAFSSSLNAGLSIIFDREFGFLNRLLVYPISSNISILIASVTFITITSLIQTMILFVIGNMKIGAKIILSELMISIVVILLVTVFFSLLSLSLAFILPGHIELLAFILIVNLPILFSSTALAPFELMPNWLQFISVINPLTYAIEALRLTMYSISYKSLVTGTYQALNILLTLDILAIGSVYIFFTKKY